MFYGKMSMFAASKKYFSSIKMQEKYYFFILNIPTNYALTCTHVHTRAWDTKAAYTWTPPSKQVCPCNIWFSKGSHCKGKCFQDWLCRIIHNIEVPLRKYKCTTRPMSNLWWTVYKVNGFESPSPGYQMDWALGGGNTGFPIFLV